MQLSEYGIIVHKEIEETPLHYKGVMIDKFVVMPNHIHMLVTIDRDNGAPGASRPTISIIIAALKKKINKMIGFSIWQTSYHDHIIRNEQEYQKIWEYIDTNQLKWDKDCFYSNPTK